MRGKSLRTSQAKLATQFWAELTEKEFPLANEIDRIMNEQPPLSDADLAMLIAYHRSFRMKIEGGKKPKKDDRGSDVKLDDLLPKASSTFKKRL